MNEASSNLEDVLSFLSFSILIIGGMLNGFLETYSSLVVWYISLTSKSSGTGFYFLGGTILETVLY